MPQPLPFLNAAFPHISPLKTIPDTNRQVSVLLMMKKTIALNYTTQSTHYTGRKKKLVGCFVTNLWT